MNKYFLSVEFHSQGEPVTYTVGEPIAFVSFRGYLKVGFIKSINWLDKDLKIPSEVFVDCDGALIKTLPDYILKKSSKVFNLSTVIKEIDNGFPLRT